MLGNEGMERESNDSFCAPTPSAMVFGRSDGDRVAVTRDLALRHGYTLQFKVPTLPGWINVFKNYYSPNQLMKIINPPSFMHCFSHKLNIGCESEFSAAAPVLLQYSHDAGRTWALVREGCYPGTPGSGICEGSGRELREPTVYNTGDYEQWTRVTVVIPRNVAAR